MTKQSGRGDQRRRVVRSVLDAQAARQWLPRSQVCEGNSSGGRDASAVLMDADTAAKVNTETDNTQSEKDNRDIENTSLPPQAQTTRARGDRSRPKQNVRFADVDHHEPARDIRSDPKSDKESASRYDKDSLEEGWLSQLAADIQAQTARDVEIPSTVDARHAEGREGLAGLLAHPLHLPFSIACLVARQLVFFVARYLVLIVVICLPLSLAMGSFVGLASRSTHAGVWFLVQVSRTIWDLIFPSSRQTTEYTAVDTVMCLVFPSFSAVLPSILISARKAPHAVVDTTDVAVLMEQQPGQLSSFLTDIHKVVDAAFRDVVLEKEAASRLIRDTNQSVFNQEQQCYRSPWCTWVSDHLRLLFNTPSAKGELSARVRETVDFLREAKKKRHSRLDEIVKQDHSILRGLQDAATSSSKSIGAREAYLEDKVAVLHQLKRRTPDGKHHPFEAPMLPFHETNLGLSMAHLDQIRPLSAQARVLTASAAAFSKSLQRLTDRVINRDLEKLDELILRTGHIGERLNQAILKREMDFDIELWGGRLLDILQDFVQLARDHYADYVQR